MSFRLKTILFFLGASLIPYLAVIFFVFFKSESDHLERIKKEHRYTLNLVTSRINAELDTVQKDLRFIAKLDVMDDIISRDIDRRISEILLAKKNDMLLQGDFFVTDTKNIVVSSSDFDAIGKPYNNNYRFKSVITSTFDDQPIGQLYLEYRLENLQKHLSADSKQVIYFVDPATGKSLLKTEEFQSPITFSNALPLMGKMEVRLDLNRDAALDIFKELRTVIIFSIIGGFLVIIAVSAYFASRITGPITTLSKVAFEITDTGDYTKRVRVQSDDEIGRLSGAFNTMIQSMDEALNRLQAESQNKIRLQEEKSKNEMLESLSKKLSKYLSPQIYNQIFEKKMDVTLESKRKKLTVFFSDIVGFTDTTESMEPEDLSALLNHYLNEMSTIALEFGGTVDKFIGDAVMIFFGDPESKGVKEDAALCVRMALKMIRRVEELKDEWYKMGVTRPFKIRIGIHTGFSTVGNFGSENRMDYTIIGNAINLASRLESASGENEITISEETQLLIGDLFNCQEKGEIAVKGFHKPVKTYRVVGEKSTKTENLNESFEGFTLKIDGSIADRAKTLSALETAIKRLKNA